MASLFSCEMDQKNFAEFCCACSFPPPCLCTACVDSHCSKPGLHFILPVQVRTEVTSERALTGLQLRLHQLGLTYKELQRVMKSFDRAKEEIEAVCRDIIDSVSARKDEYVSMLSEAAACYNQQLNAAIQESYSHSWEGHKYKPSDPFTALIWTHVPGSEANFDLLFQLETSPNLDNPFAARWSLPFPGFENHPKDAFPLRVALDQKEVILLVQPEDTLAEVKSALVKQGEIGDFPVKFTSGSEKLLENWNLSRCGLSPSSLLRLDSTLTIHVTTIDWKSLEITQNRKSTVKELIESLSALPKTLSSELYLLYQDQILAAESSLEQCSLADGANVRILQRIIVPFVISVLTPGGKRLKIEVSSSDVTVTQVKERVKAAEGLKSTLYSLVFRDIALSEEVALVYYSIVADSELNLVPNKQEITEIYVLMPSGRMVSLTLDLWTRAEQVKRSALELEGNQKVDQQLLYEGKRLQDSRFLVSYDLSRLPTLQIKPNNFQIFVTVPSGKTIILDVALTDTVQAVKAQIEAKEGIPADRQQLKLYGLPLQDMNTLEEHRVQVDSTLILVPRAVSGQPQLILKVSDKVINVSAKPSDYLKEIKARVMQAYGLELGRQNFVYHGIQLRDENRTLQELGVPMGSELSLCPAEEI